MWRVQSYQSASAGAAFDLSDASYYAYIEDKDRLQLMPTIKAVAIARGKYPPTIVGKVREMDKTKITIRIRAADWRTALKNLSAACANDEDELGTLTVLDENGDAWTIQANVENILRTGFPRVYEMPLNVPDLIWRKVATEDVWNITASEQTTTIVNTGNRTIRPSFIFKPTSVKTDGFLYRHWLPIRNPNARGYNFKSVDLTDGGEDTRAWVKSTGNYVQINNGAGITNSQTTIPYDTLTGSMPTFGMGYIDDGSNVEQISWTGRTGTTSGNLTGVTREIGGTSKHAFADNVKIYLSYCKADMSDVRYYSASGTEYNIWIDAPNTASTKIWIVASVPAGVSLTLGTAIGSGDTVTEINLRPTVANRLALNSLPKSGVLRINNEAFHFTDRDPIRWTMDIDAREVNGTTAANHAVNDAVYYISNDGFLYTGSPFLDAQETDDTREPIIDQTNSNNETRVFTSFGDADGLRADGWTPDVELSAHAAVYEASKFYGGNHTDETADPFTEMGMLMQSVYKNGAWKFETGRITWTLYEPGGIYQITEWIYETFKSGSTWPAYTKLEKSTNGVTWEQVVIPTPPTSAGTWGSPTTAGPYAAFSAGYYYLRVIMWGTQVAGQSGGVGLYSAFEVNSLKYTVDNPLVPEIMARQINSYEHNFRIVNQTTGEYFKVNFTDQLNGEIEVDCEAKTFITLADGKKHRAAIFVPNTQRDWMTLVSGNNTLKIFESGVTGLTATIVHEDQLVV